jgi:hypothetical protein
LPLCRAQPLMRVELRFSATLGWLRANPSQLQANLVDQQHQDAREKSRLQDFRSRRRCSQTNQGLSDLARNGHSLLAPILPSICPQRQMSPDAATLYGGYARALSTQQCGDVWEIKHRLIEASSCGRNDPSETGTPL